MTKDPVRTAFLDQARACRELGSPFTGAICDLLAQNLAALTGAVAQRVIDWQGDPSSRADSVPLRLCGGLHALVLTNAAPRLAQAYHRREMTPDLLHETLLQHEDFLLDWLKHLPQTNEVARSAAIIAAARFVASQSALPLRALELGASAGLNLNFARYDLAPLLAQPDQPDQPEEADRIVLRPRWQGQVPAAEVQVSEAIGVDLRPVDPIVDGLRLQAYCWADQTARLARLRAALQMALRFPPQVASGDAGAWLSARLARSVPGRVTFVYHTIAAQYFPPQTRAICAAALRAAAARATSLAPLAHFAMEADGDGDGAGLSLHLWDGRARAWSLGRADFHGRWIRWDPAPVAAGL